jgi:chromosome segregation ATPase
MTGEIMPNEDTQVKPLRVEGAEIEAVILIPKGYKGANPMGEDDKTKEEMTKLQAELSTAKNEKEVLSKKATELEAELSTAKNEKEVLSKKATELEARLAEAVKSLEDMKKAESERQKAALASLAAQIADEKIAAGLLTKEKRDESIAQLSKVGIEGLTILQADVRSFAKSKEEKPASGGTAGQQDASERELAKKKLREELGFKEK